MGIAASFNSSADILGLGRAADGGRIIHHGSILPPGGRLPTVREKILGVDDGVGFGHAWRIAGRRMNLRSRIVSVVGRLPAVFGHDPSAHSYLVNPRAIVRGSATSKPPRATVFRLVSPRRNSGYRAGPPRQLIAADFFLARRFGWIHCDVQSSVASGAMDDHPR